ncbi:hypothetical protein OSB04_012708 [Centaurea solstitialis]|uniref:Retroviral polymerase SH3-like domain-containing protein n=1 Tax=Centaurea solstitialis TaxID=347529 RepID=A0AA38WQ68_9ASTR|nr:hypothetical protein OSB04_012708 [Centaurea solstitialis]
MIQTQFSKPIKILRADKAMEYKESSLIAFLRSQGTISHHSCAGTSPQNGRAKRKHRHILDATHTLLISAKCPEQFWGEAAFMLSTPLTHIQLPLFIKKALHGITPAYELLKLQPHEHTKLQPRVRLYLFLGYGIEHKGYRCWDHISKCFVYSLVSFVTHIILLFSYQYIRLTFGPLVCSIFNHSDAFWDPTIQSTLGPSRLLTQTFCVTEMKDKGD